MTLSERDQRLSCSVVDGPTSRLTRGMGVLVTACVVALSLAACSSGNEPPTLPLYTGGASTGSTSTDSTPKSSVPAKSPTPKSPASSTKAVGAPTKATVKRGHVPSLTAQQRPVAEAWFAYWEYLTVALTDPGSPDAAGGVGKVASGKPANDAIAQIQRMAAQKTHVIGIVTVNIRSVTADGDHGSVCSQLLDHTADVNSSGAVVNPPNWRMRTIKASFTKDGPVWRLSTITRPPTC